MRLASHVGHMYLYKHSSVHGYREVRKRESEREIACVSVCMRVYVI